MKLIFQDAILSLRTTDFVNAEISTHQSSVPAPTSSNSSSSSLVLQQQQVFNTFLWRGERFGGHPFPEEFHWPHGDGYDYYSKLLYYESVIIFIKLYYRITARVIHDLWHFGDGQRKIRPYSKIDPKALRSPKEKKHASMAKTVVAFIDRHLNLETYLVSSAEARDASFATAWSNVETEIFNVALEGNPALNRTSRITPLKQLAYNSLYSNFLTKVPRK